MLSPSIAIPQLLALVLALPLPLAGQATRQTAPVPTGACALVRPEEIQAAVGSAVVSTTQRDTTALGVRRSRCVVKVRAGLTESVFIEMRSPLPPVADAAALARAVSDPNLPATPTTGFPYPTVVQQSAGVVMAQRGTVRVSVVAFNLAKSRAVAQHVIPRIP